jgi:hypothetical protein
MNIFFTLAGISIFTGYIIFFLTGKNKLHTGISLWWLGGAFLFGTGCLLSGFFSISFQAADKNFLFIFLISTGICSALLKRLLTDMKRTQEKVKLRRHIQHLALLKLLTPQKKK